MECSRATQENQSGPHRPEIGRGPRMDSLRRHFRPISVVHGLDDYPT